ncbi:MAG: class I SAM-dependent methyltransferase, partial [Hyphomicrobium denitrificans]|nr:class I SAM-dependent methyltransferase [Hyphomicrobium denitrificans]
MAGGTGQDRQLEAARALVRDVADRFDLNAWARLWDGSRLPLGKAPTSNFEISISDPGVIGTLVRSPRLDTIIRQYIEKGIDFSGGTLVDFGRDLQKNDKAPKVKGRDIAKVGRNLLPFVFAKKDARDAHGFSGDESGVNRKIADNKDYIQFHYDLSNDFYALFLDPEMVYSCAYYTDWSNGVEQAQRDKLEMICRKLRLKSGDRMLDIGAGWGGLLCHAAQAYGVTAHGITLSEEQLSFAREKAKKLGLADRVTFELADYQNISGTYDKIASIGMYEHIGLKNIPGYMSKVRSLLSEDGLFLNHAISHRAPKN